MSDEADAPYSGNPADSDLDAVRFALADTNNSGSGFILTDPEIQYLLDTESSITAAAATGARNIAAVYGSKADKSVGDLSIRYASRRDYYMKLSETLEHKTGTSGSALTGITGGRGSQRDPIFWLGQMRYPGTPVTDYSTSLASVDSFSASASTST